MKLYHGTSERIAKLALKDGLLPRSMSGVVSHWEDNPSSESHIYLSTAYAAYFAMIATDSEQDGRWAILEIDTDKLPDGGAYLVPDEDFLEQVSRGQDLSEVAEALGGDTEAWSGSMEERTKWFRENLDAFAHLWEDSVERLGNCAHEGLIPPEAITRVSYVESSKNHLVTMALDPCITLMNYAICGNKYRALTRWLMGYEVVATDFLYGGALQLSNMSPEDAPPEMESFIRHQAAQNAAMEKAISDRAGLEVTNVLDV